jgi:hypothetical protein
MKTILKLLSLSYFVIFLSGCETYEDYTIDHSPIYPLCGQWVVKFTDVTAIPNVTSGWMIVNTFNTADNSTTQMWIRSATSSATFLERFCGKIDCNTGTQTFEGGPASNTFYTAAPLPTFTITEGKIETGAYLTATGGISDKITFTITDSRKTGITFKVTGFRRTRWLEDEV